MEKRRGENQSKKRQGNIYDVFAKDYFGRVLVFSDFLRNYADERFIRDVDVTKIKSEPTHYFGKDGNERIADMIFSCPLRNSDAAEKAVVVFEHQSNSLKRLPIKLHAYASAIWTAEVKAGKKTLSALYFIVLRTGKKPVRKITLLADWLPKGSDKKPIGAVPEIEYTLVDLPEFDIKALRGGPVLRTGLGILKKMSEGTEEEFPEALLPLLEVNNEEQQIDLLKQILEFTAKVFTAHNKRFDDKTVGKVLNVIFKERSENMKPTIFDEKFMEGVAEGRAEGKAEGRAEGKAEGVAEGRAKGIAEAEAERKPKWIAEGQVLLLLTILQSKFSTVPMKLQNRLLKITDLSRIQSLATAVANCTSLKEFEKLLGK